MSGWVYLIRNGDLHKIGITQNLEQRMRTLKPDEIVSKLRTENYEQLEKQLHRKYKNVRIPQTEYFRLTDSQLESCKNALQRGEGETNFLDLNIGYDPSSSDSSEDVIAVTIFLCIGFTLIPILVFGGIIDLFVDSPDVNPYFYPSLITGMAFFILSPLYLIIKFINIFRDKENKLPTPDGISAFTWFSLFFIAIVLLLSLVPTPPVEYIPYTP